MHINSPSTLLAAALVLVLCIACDRAAKHAAESLRGKPPREIAGGLMTLSYAENRGAMLSLGAGLPERTRFLIFTAGVGLLLAGIAGVILFAPALSPPLVTGLSLILAGGGSNLFDRLANDGRVVDFVTLGAGGIRTGIFNLADVAIMLGASLFLLTMIRQQHARTA
ncbi:MAG TPA: signal peptidase II [Bacteroidota bacterium]